MSSLREQWRNILRKTKLDLTTLMRQAKIAELERVNREYQEQIKNLSDHLHEPYDTMCRVSRTRHNQFAKRKLNFLAKRGVHNERKLVRALSRHHPRFSTAKLHPHYSRIGFPPQANNKISIFQGAESAVLNLGPKFVPPAPEQVLERLPTEIK